MIEALNHDLFGWMNHIPISATTLGTLLGPLQPLLHPTKLEFQGFSAALNLIIALSTGLTVVWLIGSLGMRAGQQPTELPRRGGQVWLGVFLFVCGLLLVNQLLVNVFILREHEGNAGFVTRYLPSGWFVLATKTAAVRWLNTHLPSGANVWLPYTILRVQAGLELPFVISSYLAVTEFLSPALARVLWRSLLLPAALVSFTATFCLIEMMLWNPWTVSDLHWRWGSCAAGFAVWTLSRLLGSPAPLAALAGSPARLAVVLCGGGALVVGVLGIYVVTLLYNLGHLVWFWPWLLGCAGVVVCAAALSSRAQRGTERSALSGVFAGLGAFAGVFFVPSLAIRYAGLRPVAGSAALVLAIVALLGAVLLLVRRRPATWELLGLGLFVAVGALAAWVDARGLHLMWRPAGFPQVPELRLLRGAVLFLVAGGMAAMGLDGVKRFTSRRQ